MIVLFTDGVTEAAAPDGTMCGAEWALDVVRSRAGRSAAETLEGICEAVRGFADGGFQQDDVTSVICRVSDRW